MAAGAFVSLHVNGQLRGCIGTIQATKDSLAEAGVILIGLPLYVT